MPRIYLTRYTQRVTAGTSVWLHLTVKLGFEEVSDPPDKQNGRQLVTEHREMAKKQIVLIVVLVSDQKNL